MRTVEEIEREMLHVVVVGMIFGLTEADRADLEALARELEQVGPRVEG